ncbi:MAG: hypothetical protein IKB57_01125, partial [Bacteroidaceae bacterium]|nr:hypothetical protein [Bacteroidaceae bacterium]
MKTRRIFIALMLMLSIPAIAQRSVFDDDIYYSPKTDSRASKKVISEVTTVETTTTTTVPTTQSVSQTQTVSTIQDMDVDAYNRRYTSDYTPIEVTTQEVVPQTTTTTTSTTQTYYVNEIGNSNLQYT